MSGPLDFGVGELGKLGYNEQVEALFAAVLPELGPTCSKARVVRVERSRSVVVGPGGEESLVTSDDLLAVGDWVATSDEVVRRVMPRWSAVMRKDPSGAGDQVLAANVDLVLVTAPGDRYSPARIERELSIAWDSGARPVVVLTKADLAAETAFGDLRERLAGVDLMTTDAKSGSGIDEVRALLRPDLTAVLLGPSGAGKSTLANSILGDDRLATGNVRGGDRRGRHTTTSRQLVGVPGGGVLIDTPGLRSLGLAGDGAIDQVFPEIESLASGCRFADCRHEVEPGCAVVEAGRGGGIDPARLASFRKLQGEIAADARHADPLIRREELKKRKALSRGAKAAARDKRRPGS